MNTQFKASLWWIGCAENENGEIEQVLSYKSSPDNPMGQFFTGKIYGVGRRGMEMATTDFLRRNG